MATTTKDKPPRTRSGGSSAPKGDAAKDAGSGKAKASGPDLFKGLLAEARTAFDASNVKKHYKDAYFRVFKDGRNVAYVVRGKTKLNVYPQMYARDVPKDLGFRQVEIGAHHYGRGEVVVPVESEKDFDTAIKAMKAAASAPPLERKKPARAKKPEAQAAAA